MTEIIKFKQETRMARANVVVGQFLRNNRKARGMTGKELAAKLHLSQQHISRLELGKTAFTLELIILILNVLNIRIEDFINDLFITTDNDLLPLKMNGL